MDHGRIPKGGFLQHLFPDSVSFTEFSIRLLCAVQEDNYAILIQPEGLIHGFYPELKKAMELQIEAENKQIDVLLLSGSVLNKLYEIIKTEMQQQLPRRFDCPVVISNLAVSSDTSLDSRVKYELLEDRHFDVVVLYHGINEVRFNNCPEKEHCIQLQGVFNP